MKKISLLIVLLMMFSTNISAKPISESVAKTVGSTYLQANAKKNKMSGVLQLAYKSQKTNTDGKAPVTFYYVFNDGDKGFVIVSGDDLVIPILGYSDYRPFNPEDMNPAVKSWLQGYEEQIRYAIEHQVTPQQSTKDQWTSLLNGDASKSRKFSTAVAALVKTKWGQAPYENQQCPYDILDMKRTLTGCPATAMAQIMKYWNYPAQGTGFHSYSSKSYGLQSVKFQGTAYDWNAMPDKLTEVEESVGKLMYHCGVAVEMEYGTDMSASLVIKGYPENNHTDQQTSENAFVQFFGYDGESVKGIVRESMSSQNWIMSLINELDQKRPIQYAGFRTGGHTWVCDGYDLNGLFHMNWGWGGKGDGNFTVDNLVVGDNNFNDMQHAIVGIKPKSAPKYKLQLGSDMSMTSTHIKYMDPISLTANVTNSGSTDFSGQIGAVVFDQNNKMVDFISTVDINIPTETTSTLTFSNLGNPNLIKGNYHVELYHLTLKDGLNLIPGNGFADSKSFDVYHSAVMETNSTFNIENDIKNLLYVGEDATIRVDIKNTGPTFLGHYRLVLTKNDQLAANILGEIEEANGLPENSHYPNGREFKVSIDPKMKPGLYRLSLEYKPEGSSQWELAGSSQFSNPVFVNVLLEKMQPDPYEKNDTIGSSYKLLDDFTGDTMVFQTDGASIHRGLDVDYYSLHLDPGYDYTVITYLEDAFTYGSEFTARAYITRVDNNGYRISDTAISELPEFVLENGGYVNFVIEPVMPGFKGTYELGIRIERTLLATQDSAVKDLLIYPNPAKQEVTIDLNQFAGKVQSVQLINTAGQNVLSQNWNSKNKSLKLDLKGIPAGMYFVQIHSDKGSISKKLIVEK